MFHIFSFPHSTYKAQSVWHYKIFFKFNIIKVKPKMGREPKHGFVAWLEFKQKAVRNPKARKLTFPSQDHSKTSSPAALCTQFLYRHPKK